MISDQHAPSVSAADGALVVLTTAPDMATAEQLADAVVESGLAACVSIVPGVRSIYRWQGKVQRDDELLLLIKSDRARQSALFEHLGAAHPYDCPELLALPVERAEPEYLAWLIASGRQGGDPE